VVRVETNTMGHVVGTVDGESEYVVVVAAHMDEIGFMVKHVTDDWSCVSTPPAAGIPASARPNG